LNVYKKIRLSLNEISLFIILFLKTLTGNIQDCSNPNLFVWKESKSKNTILNEQNGIHVYYKVKLRHK